MTDISRESEESISLLGNQHTQYPTDYDPSVLETFLNKHPENDYFVKFNCPEFTSLCPHLYLLCSERAHGGKQEPEAVSVQLPQSW